jgi:hypothetical protein
VDNNDKLAYAATLGRSPEDFKERVAAADSCCQPHGAAVCGFIRCMNRDSDLIAIPFILGLFLAVIVVTAAFFFVGAWLGITLLILSMVFIGYAAYRGLAGNGES